MFVSFLNETKKIRFAEIDSEQQVGGINRVGSTRKPSRRSSCESQITGDEVSLRELAPGPEEKPRTARLGKRNIKAQVLNNTNTSHS